MAQEKLHRRTLLNDTSPMHALRALFFRLKSYSRDKLWARRTRNLQVCETISLGNRGFLAVVRYHKQEFLVGGTSTSLGLIAPLCGGRGDEDLRAIDDRVR